jgi:hypothetical protein
VHYEGFDFIPQAAQVNGVETALLLKPKTYRRVGVLLFDNPRQQDLTIINAIIAWVSWNLHTTYLYQGISIVNEVECQLGFGLNYAWVEQGLAMTVIFTSSVSLQLPSIIGNVVVMNQSLCFVRLFWSATYKC